MIKTRLYRMWGTIKKYVLLTLERIVREQDRSILGRGFRISNAFASGERNNPSKAWIRCLGIVQIQPQVNADERGSEESFISD
jgi:hypothetical protein